MKTIDSNDGVRQLMQNMWLKHLCGEKQDVDNVYLVDFRNGEASDTHMSLPIPNFSERTVGWYLQQVNFDDILSQPRFNWCIHGNTIVLYDAFSYLRSIVPSEVATSKTFEVTGTPDSGILGLEIKMDLPENWLEFLNRRAMVPDIALERWIGTLLLHLTDNGTKSIHRFVTKESFFNKRKESSNPGLYIKLNRIYNWLRKFGLGFLLKRKTERLLNQATLSIASGIDKSTLKKGLGEIYGKIIDAKILVVRDIRSYGGSAYAFDAIHWALHYYDSEKSEPFDDCAVIINSNFMKNQSFDTIKKHFATENMFWISNEYDGIDLTFIRYNPK